MGQSTTRLSATCLTAPMMMSFYGRVVGECGGRTSGPGRGSVAPAPPASEPDDHVG